MTFSKLTFGSIPKLVERLRDETNIDTVIGFSIVNAINSNKLSDTKILETVQSQAKDNLLAMQIVIGEQLCNDILNLNL